MVVFLHVSSLEDKVVVKFPESKDHAVHFLRCMSDIVHCAFVLYFITRSQMMKYRLDLMTG